jgi:hypothetical protein
MHIISIDPSIKTIGITFWNDSRPVLSGVINMSKHWEKDGSVAWICELSCFINYILDKYKVLGYTPEETMLIIEVPGFYYDDTNKKTIQSLRETCGLIQGLFFNFCNHIKRVTPSQWKGRGSKQVTMYNMGKIYPHLKHLSWRLDKDGRVHETITKDIKKIGDIRDSQGIGHDTISKMKMAGEL